MNRNELLTLVCKEVMRSSGPVPWQEVYRRLKDQAPQTQLAGLLRVLDCEDWGLTNQNIGRIRELLAFAEGVLLEKCGGKPGEWTRLAGKPQAVADCEIIGDLGETMGFCYAQIDLKMGTLMIHTDTEFHQLREDVIGRILDSEGGRP